MHLKASCLFPTDALFVLASRPMAGLANAAMQHAGAGMLIGIDWGGTKIEGIALDAGRPRAAARAAATTPQARLSGLHRGDRRAGRAARAGDRRARQRSASACRARSSRARASARVRARPGCSAGRSEHDLREALRREIRVENDADCFAASEAVDGAGAGYNVVFAVILGSGAGAGIAVGGRAHHGPNNSAGEWGHNPLPFPTSPRSPARPATAASMAAWRPGSRAGLRGRLCPAHAATDLKAGDIVAQGCAPATGWRGWSGAATSIGSRAACPSSSTRSTRTCWSWAAGCPTSTSCIATCPALLAALHVLDRVRDADPQGGARRLQRRARRRLAVEGRLSRGTTRQEPIIDAARCRTLRVRVQLIARPAPWRWATSGGSATLAVSSKGPQDMASEADLETEVLIRGRLTERFPRRVPGRGDRPRRARRAAPASGSSTRSTAPSPSSAA